MSKNAAKHRTYVKKTKYYIFVGRNVVLKMLINFGLQINFSKIEYLICISILNF